MLHDPEVIGKDCPALSLDEWYMLCDTLNCAVRSDDLAPFLFHEVWDSDQDDYSFDLKEFSGRLEKYSDSQNLAILHAVDNFWGLESGRVNIREQLIRAGANIKPE